MGRSDSQHALKDQSRRETNKSYQYLGNPAGLQKENRKRPISTSHMFDKKLAGPRPTGKGEASKAVGGVPPYHRLHKTTKALRRKNHHSPKKEVKRSEKGEHPLYHALVENDNSYRAEVRANVDASIETSHSALTQRLAATLDATKTAVLKHQDLKEELFRPLGTEQLALNTTINGVTHTDKVHLGQRVEAFRTLTANKTKELDVLWREWASVQKQIVALGMEVLGPGAFDIKRDTTTEGDSTTHMPAPFFAPQQASKVEFDRMVHELEGEVRSIGDKTSERLEASEKVSFTCHAL
ncbi:MAG: hypothetical protein M1836_004905 [Candelina mexicana]|nr:MAG: hypothetical protein M1836_004905 [Candelina mexicana]